MDEDSELGVLGVAICRVSLGARYTHVIMLGGAESDHYKCPLCSLLFGGGQAISLRAISSWELQRRGEQKVMQGLKLTRIDWLSLRSCLVVARMSTGCQSLKYTFHLS